MDIESIVAMAPVIPVLTIDKVSNAVPLARALVKGGLKVLEITLRTGTALESLAAIVRDVPEAVVGAGTVLDEAQLRQAQQAGARFGVSPGCTRELASATRAANFPFLPGVQTVSEAMALAGQGFRILKFFPAEQAGGTGWLKAIGAPLGSLRFCPTGGVTAETAPSYLALPNVACVGGSWVAPKRAVESGDWDAIGKLATDASALTRNR